MIKDGFFLANNFLYIILIDLLYITEANVYTFYDKCIIFDIVIILNQVNQTKTVWDAK